MIAIPKQSTDDRETRESIPDNWVESCRPRLLAYAKSRLSHDVAEDLTQETLMTAMQKLETFRGHGKFENWLLAVLRRKILNYWRRQKRSKPISSDKLEILLATKTTFGNRHTSEEPCRLYELEELGDVIEQALNELPENQTRVMRLSRDSDMSSKEIALLLDLSLQNVWVSLHRARKHLKCRVDQYVMS